MTGAPLSLQGLKRLLQQAWGDKHAASEHVRPIRHLAKLLHGPDADTNAVPVAQLLPQLGVLLQRMRDRVSGSSPDGKHLQPKSAASHAAAVLRVLGVAEVQAVLQGPQQVQELAAAVYAAQLEFEALDAAMTSGPAVQHPADDNHQHHDLACTGSAAAASEGLVGRPDAGSEEAAHTGTNWHEDVKQEACFLDADTGRPPSPDPSHQPWAQQMVAAAAAAAPAAPRTTSDADALPTTAADAEAAEAAVNEAAASGQPGSAAGSLSVAQLQLIVQATPQPSEYIARIIRTLNRLLQLVHGPDADASAVQAADLLLQWPVLHVHLLQRLRSDSELDRIKPATATKVYAWGMRKLLAMPHVQQQLGSQQLQQLQQRVEADAATYTVAATHADGVQPAQSDSAAGAQQKRRKQQPGTPQHSSDSQPASSASSGGDGSDEEWQPADNPFAADGRAFAAATLQHLPKRLRQEGTAVAAAAAADDMECDTSAQHPLQQQQQHAGLSLRQLASGMQHCLDEHTLSRRLTPLRQLARLLHGPAFDPAAVQVADLLRAWDVYGQQLQQQVAGTHATLPVISPITANNYALYALAWAAEPLVRSQLSEQELQQFRDRVAATKAAIRAASAAAASRGPGRQLGRPPSSSLGLGAQGDSSKAVSPAVGGSPHTSMPDDNSNCNEHAAAAAPGLPADAAPQEPSSAPSGSGTSSAAAAGAAGAAAPAGGGLSLQQLELHLRQQHTRTDASTHNMLIPLKNLARLLHGPDYDAGTCSVAGLLAHWDVLSLQMLQQLAGTHESLPPLASSTVLLYTSYMSQLLNPPLVRAQLPGQALKHIKSKLAASRAAFKAAAAAAAAAVAAGAAAAAAGEATSPAQSAAPQSTTQAACSSGDPQQQHQEGAPGRQGASALPWKADGSDTAAVQPSTPDFPQSAAVAASSGLAASPLSLISEPEAAAGPSVMPVQPAHHDTGAAAVSGINITAAAVEHDLIAAGRQLLWLYVERLQPSLEEKLAFRAATQALSRLAADDIRLARFWADYDWLLLLREEAESTAQHWREAFDALLQNAAGPS